MSLITSIRDRLRKRSENVKVRGTLQGILFASALLLIGFGLLRGEAVVVLRKAVHVCLECIGIG